MAPQILDLRSNRQPVRIGQPGMPMRHLVAATVFDVVDLWAQIDLSLATFISDMADRMAVDQPTKVIEGSLAKKCEWLEKNAAKALPPDDAALLIAAINVSRTSRDQRNELAHDVWGFIAGRVDVVLLCANESAVRFIMSMKQQASSVEEWQERHGIIQIAVWTAQDLHDAVARAQRAHRALWSFNFAFLSPSREHFQQKLMDDPEIAAEYARLRP